MGHTVLYEGLTGVYDDTSYTIVVERYGDFEYTTALGAYKKVPKGRYLGRPDERDRDIGGWWTPRGPGTGVATITDYFWKGRPIKPASSF
jgi:hypothetical protein